MKIFETNREELMELCGGAQLNKNLKFRGESVELIIFENEFNYAFDLYIGEDLIFTDNFTMESFQFEYENQNENGSHIENLYNILATEDENNINTIMAEINSEFKNYFNL